MQPFCVTRIIFHFSLKTAVDSWNPISVFNLSTLELDNTLQRLSFAGLVATDSARWNAEWLQIIWYWLQIGYKFEMWEKEKSRKSLIYRTLSWALQDGLEPTTPWLTVRCSNQLSYWSRNAVSYFAVAKVIGFSETTKLFCAFFLFSLSKYSFNPSYTLIYLER